MKHKLLFGILGFLAVCIILLVVEFMYIQNHDGITVDAPAIPRQAQQFGTDGPKLTYVVMGDSTSIGQGTTYDKSYATASAQHLAKTHQVTMVNVGISGATTRDVLDVQLTKAVKYKADVVLIGVGSNDAVHFNSGKTVQTSLQAIVDGLKKANPQVKIVVTGSAAVDGAARFSLFPSNQLMHLRTYQVNHAFESIIAKNGLTWAKVADHTRAAFKADPTLLASDKFHPNGRGYALWTPVINSALDQALAEK